MHAICYIATNEHYLASVGTVDFTSQGTPVGVAAGNLWLVRLATFTLQPMEQTNHKFPAEAKKCSSAFLDHPSVLQCATTLKVIVISVTT